MGVSHQPINQDQQNVSEGRLYPVSEETMVYNNLFVDLVFPSRFVHIQISMYKIKCYVGHSVPFSQYLIKYHIIVEYGYGSNFHTNINNVSSRLISYILSIIHYQRNKVKMLSNVDG